MCGGRGVECVGNIFSLRYFTAMRAGMCQRYTQQTAIIELWASRVDYVVIAVIKLILITVNVAIKDTRLHLLFRFDI